MAQIQVARQDTAQVAQCVRYIGSGGGQVSRCGGVVRLVLPHNLGCQAVHTVFAVERKRGYRRNLSRTAAQQQQQRQESEQIHGRSSFDGRLTAKRSQRMKNHG